MIEKKIVKTVRFKEAEIERIEAFLKENPALDFSTLIRLSVENFMSSPRLKSINKSNNNVASTNSKDTLWN